MNLNLTCAIDVPNRVLILERSRMRMKHALLLTNNFLKAIFNLPSTATVFKLFETQLTFLVHHRSENTTRRDTCLCLLISK